MRILPGFRVVVRRLALVTVPALFLAGCGEAGSTASLAQRDTLPDGRVVVSYASIPVVREDTLVEEVRIGSEDGGGPEVFGDVRAIEVGADGTIYVLDSQASEVRTFTPDGRHLATLGGSGQGPGELSGANGFAFAPDGTLWINDHRSRALIGLSADGTEVGRHPQIVPGYGYVWSGLVDARGVFWEQWSHAERDVPFDITATGLLEGVSRRYFKSYDPRTQAYDSVLIGPTTYRSLRAAYPGGQMVLGLPFAPTPLAVADRSGNIWTASTDAYTITRMSTAGDTLLVLRVEAMAPLVTAEDRAQWAEGMASAFERVPSIRAQLESHIPERKPILTRLVIDDAGRLWVGRTVPAGEAPLFDAFSPEGEHLGAVRFFAGTALNVGPVIRGNRAYAIVRDELDVPYVVAAPLPPFASAR